MNNAVSATTNLLAALLAAPVRGLAMLVDIVCPPPITVERHRTYINNRATSGLRRGDELLWRDQCGGK